jgi:hypothetical protein
LGDQFQDFRQTVDRCAAQPRLVYFSLRRQRRIDQSRFSSHDRAVDFLFRKIVREAQEFAPYADSLSAE